MTRDPDEEPLPPLLMREAGPVPCFVAIVAVIGVVMLWALYLQGMLK